MSSCTTCGEELVATGYGERCDNDDCELNAEPTERQLECMASGDHYPDYDHQMAEARKLK